MNLVCRLFHCKRGVSMVEYAIMLALIAAISISAVAALGAATRGAFTSVSCNGLHGEASGDCSGGGPGQH